MNRYDLYITEYLTNNREVALEKIGTLKLLTDHPDPDSMAGSVTLIFDRKISSSPGLIDFITEKSGKLRSLIESDLESHFTQVREFLNIGKTYEVSNAGFIKSNNKGEYEFVPYPQTGKTQKSHSQPARASGRRDGRSAVQVLTFFIVIAIVAGIGWEAYQFYIKPKTSPAQNAQAGLKSGADSLSTGSTIDSQAAPIITYKPDDTVNVRYIFETTSLRLRAVTRTAQLNSFGNTAGFDSSVAGNRKLYSLFIYKKTKIADTLAVKDSLQKFLQKNIQIQIEPKQ